MTKIYHIITAIFISSFMIASQWVGINSINPVRFEAKSISSDIETTDVQFRLNGYTLTPVETPWGTQYKIETEGGSSIMDAGSPDLDQMFASVIIPDNSEMSLEVISSSYIEIENIDIAPSKGNLNRSILPEDVPFNQNETYAEDQFYPGELADLRDPYILRDFRGQTVVSYPFQYNPISKTLRVYTDITVRLSSIGPGQENVLQRSSSLNKIDSEFNSIYQNQFINFEDNETRFEYLVDQGNMLVICYDGFMSEMEPFVEWKNRKGIPTEMVSVSSIGSSSSAIQNYVSDYYYDNGLTFLLLVGDADQIPTPIISGASSDPSYGFISGNDSYAEVIVGRFSGSTPSHIATQVERSLTYEQNPSQTSHFNNALGIASNQGPGYGGYSDNDFNDFLWETLLSDYTYDSFQGIYDPNGTVSEGVNAVNSGVGIINYTGHAGPTGWGNGAPLSVNDVEGLSNGGKLPFIWTVGCNPGEFNNYGTCFTEAWLRSTDSNGDPIGAVGHLGSTISQSWEPPMHGQWAFNSILTELYDDNYTRTFGGVSINGCMHMNDAQGSSGINETNHWTLFGDPSLLVRSDIPQNMSISHDSAIILGQENFIIDLGGINGALAAISKDGELLGSAYSEGGIAIINLNPEDITPGSIDLVITAFNTYPYESEVTVVAPDGAYFIYSSYEVASDSDFNQYIEASNVVDITLFIENVGSENVNPLSVLVTTDDPFIDMIDGETFIAYAIAGEIRPTAEPITFYVAGNTPDNYFASFNALFSDGQESWESNFSIEIHAPQFELANPVVLDNGLDGVWDAGEGAVIEVDLLNVGSAGFGWYPGAYIETDSPFVEILTDNNENTFYGIDANDAYDGYFQVFASEETPPGTSVDFTVYWGPSSISENWCNENLCPDLAVLTFSAIIGLQIDTNLMVPQNVLASAQNDGSIYIEWDEALEFDCNAESPYLDECYAYVIEIDPYCCNYNWDGICESEYQDCINQGGDNSGNNNSSQQLNNSNRNIIEFNNDIFNQIANREVTGYYIFRDDEFIDFTQTTYYYDVNVVGGIEYCYSVSAVYDNAQSNISDQSCVESYIVDFIAGDVNLDSTLDVLDIVIVVNMIFELEEPNYLLADVNGDSVINVLDVILIVNSILDE